MTSTSNRTSGKWFIELPFGESLAVTRAVVAWPTDTTFIINDFPFKWSGFETSSSLSKCEDGGGVLKLIKGICLACPVTVTVDKAR